MLQDREQYIKKLEAEYRETRLWNSLAGGVMFGGWVPYMGYEGLMHLIGRETQGPEVMGLLLTGVIVGPSVAFIREWRGQKRELQNQVRNTGPAGRFQ